MVGAVGGCVGGCAGGCVDGGNKPPCVSTTGTHLHWKNAVMLIGPMAKSLMVSTHAHRRNFVASSRRSDTKDVWYRRSSTSWDPHPPRCHPTECEKAGEGAWGAEAKGDMQTHTRTRRQTCKHTHTHTRTHTHAHTHTAPLYSMCRPTHNGLNVERPRQEGVCRLDGEHHKVKTPQQVPVGRVETAACKRPREGEQWNGPRKRNDAQHLAYAVPICGWRCQQLQGSSSSSSSNTGMHTCTCVTRCSQQLCVRVLRCSSLCKALHAMHART